MLNEKGFEEDPVQFFFVIWYLDLDMGLSIICVEGINVCIVLIALVSWEERRGSTKHYTVMTSRYDTWDRLDR